MGSTAGKQLFAGLIDSKNGLEEFIKMDLYNDLFSQGEQDVFHYITQHVNKHGVMPDRATITHELDVTLPTALEPPSYYLDKVEDRRLHIQMKHALETAKDYLNDNAPSKALNQLSTFVMNANLVKHRQQMVNFNQDAHKIITTDYKKHLLLGDDYGLSLGWPYLDKLIGGLLGGDLLVLASRPGAGKSYLQLYCAHHIWHNTNKVPMFVSMEMKPLPLVQRITAIHSSTSITNLKTAALSTKAYTKVKTDLKDLHSNHVPFWIIDGNLAATVNQITLLARQLKPDIVFVDGAYLLRSENPNTPRWERIAANCELLKEQLAGDLDIPVIGSYQFNKEATKVKKPEDIGLEHIGGSEAIGQIASIVLGLRQPESIETASTKQIDVLKGRGGEFGSFRTNWVFDQYPHMDFSQYEQGNADLEFI